MDTDLRREAIRRTLVQSAGGAADAAAVAAATLCTWHKVAGRLAPVIGARGVDVLFRRALEVTSKDFPWLAIAADEAHSAALFERLV